MILHILQMNDGETREEVPMNVMIQQPAAHETERMQANREELVGRIARAMRQDGTAQPLPGLHLHRHSVPMARVHGVVKPSRCAAAPGSKEAFLAESPYPRYSFAYRLVTVD